MYGKSPWRYLFKNLIYLVCFNIIHKNESLMHVNDLSISYLHPLDLTSLESLKGHSAFQDLKASYASAFTILDIVKIFGRLSDRSIVGNGIFDTIGIALSKRDSQRYKKWEVLFKSSDTISKEQFIGIIPKLKFSWPVTSNTGQIPNHELIDVPVAPKIFISVCKDYKANWKNEKSFDAKHINKYVGKQPISLESLDAVFLSFADNNEYLTKERFVHEMKARAPSDGIIDWPTFIYFLGTFPQENISKFLD